MDKVQEEQLEAYEIKGRLYNTPLPDLLKVITENQLTEDTEQMTRFKAIQIIDKWYEKEIQGEDGGTTASLILNDALPKFNMVLVAELKADTKKETAEPPTEKNETKSSKEVVRWKDFKVSGQINDSKNGLAFVSLIRQIENGVKKGYSEVDIIDGVIKAIVSGSELRNYLEGRSDLTLKSLRRMLRAHFHEKTATEIYQDLGNATQQKNEDPQEFLLRLMGMRQKISFVSKEAGSEMIYDDKLIAVMFKRTLYTGIHDDVVRREIQPTLEKPNVTDEELLQALSAIMSRERERKAKMVKGRMNFTTASVENEDDGKGTPKRPIKEGLVVGEIKELRAEIAALREIVGKMPTENTVEQGKNKPNRPRGCHDCQATGSGSTCRHCWICGSSEHISRGCLQRYNNQGNARGSPQEGQRRPNQRT